MPDAERPARKPATPNTVDATSTTAHDSRRGALVEVRCDNRGACVEVVARLVAADRSMREGFPEIAEQLRETAATWAQRHDYGQGEAS